jgi:glucose/arabinose dehydrogenase
VRRTAVLLLTALCVLCLAGSASAITPPSGFIDTTVANGLSSPTSMVWDPASARLFVTEQGGDLRVVEDGLLLGTPALHLNVDSNGERGLLGVELDPAFASNHHLYLYYTVPSNPPHNRVSRFTLQGNTVVPGSEVVLDNLDNLSGATNHNGGGIHFGGDGKLYFAAGENADPPNSQSLDNQLGKIMRMSSDGSVPTDNPFFNDPSVTGRNKLIYAYGLRNPFTFGFQPGTGRLFVNDVGQSTYEEIDDGAAGANYGWPDAEGPADPPNAAFTDPLFCYRHSTSSPNCASTGLTGCAITGGTFYNPPVAYFPAQYVGRYFFSDLCSGWIEQLDPSNGNAVTDFASGGSAPIDLDTGPDGSLYYLEDGDRVGRISFVAPPTLSGFEPAAGPVGQRVEIDGTYFAGATDVTFNGVAAVFSVVWDTRLVATVPAGATSGPIEVTTGDGSIQSAGDFNVTPSPPAPSVSGFAPTTGGIGTSVTISGSHFTDASAVRFGGTDAATFAVDSDGQITATVAPGTTSGPVAVTGPGGTGTSAGSFTVVASPVVTKFSPASGGPGKKVTIQGVHLGGATAVTFGGTEAASFTVKSDKKISAIVAVGSTTGPIAVTTPGGTATSSGSFVVPPPPVVTDFTPTSGPVGTKITITGMNFTGAKTVTIGGTKAKSVKRVSPTTVTAVVRKGTTSGQIAVTGPGGTGVSAGSFTVT